MTGLDRGNVSAIVVTRGDVDLGEILESLQPFREVLVWDNGAGLIREHYGEGHKAVGSSRGPGITDLGVYGRYAAIEWAHSDVIYVQDDDCVIEANGLLAHLAGQRNLAVTAVCNMPVSRWADYPDSALVGWGALFHRDLPAAAFARFNRSYPGSVLQTFDQDPGWFHRTADVVFTGLTPCVKVDVGFRHLPWAETPGRMFKQPGHKAERDRMLELTRQIREAA